MTHSYETVKKINTIAVLMDLVDQYLRELPSDYRHGMKFLTENARMHVRKLIREFDRIHSKENQEGFGLVADQLRKIIEKYTHEQIS